MIIGNTAKIGIGKNLKYLLDKGYELPYEKDNRGRLTTGQSKTIDIQIKDLPPMSNAKVRVMCEYCKVCLLYTSPSPRDRTRSRMPSSA